MRKAAGFSQREFAAEVGISNRALAYYEAQTDRAPAALLPEFARVLAVTTDVLLGVAPARTGRKTGDSRVWRRCSRIEKLPPLERRQLLQLIDAFLEREQLRKKASG
jgi:transcriptional regulator with XRE-family HTH domain